VQDWTVKSQKNADLIYIAEESDITLCERLAGEPVSVASLLLLSGITQRILLKFFFIYYDYTGMLLYMKNAFLLKICEKYLEKRLAVLFENILL